MLYNSIQFLFFSYIISVMIKDREREVALAAIEEEMRHKLREKEEELQALQTRELQKLAAVSGLDEQKDVLSKQIEELISVSSGCILSHYVWCLVSSSCITFEELLC